MSLIDRQLGHTDVLSTVLRSVRLDSCVQFRFIASGDWLVDAPERLWSRGDDFRLVPFHIVVEGQCWVRFEGREIPLSAGDVIALPHGSSHMLGAGRTGMQLDPLGDLPNTPWETVPLLNYASGDASVQIVCGFLECCALDFPPVRQSVPRLIHVRTSDGAEASWISAAVRQIVSEVSVPSAGGRTLLERMTETMFVELLRREVATSVATSMGWVAAVRDISLGKCLAAIHTSVERDWTIEDLADIAGISRSVLIERFRRVLGTAPIGYVRKWRLHIASLKLRETSIPIAEIAYQAGYSSEAAFNRAFKAARGLPPAAWRAAIR